MQNQSEKLARSAAGLFSDDLISKQKKLETGAKESKFEYKVTGFFAQNEAIPGLGYKRSLAAETFDTLKRKNEISNAVRRKSLLTPPTQS